LKFREATQNAQAGNATPTPAQLDQWCDPCVIQFVYRLAYANIGLGGNVSDLEEEVNFLKLTQYACVKDFKNNYCLPQLSTYDFASLGGVCITGLVAQPPTCSGDCKNAVVKAKSDLGCCFGTWFNFLEWQSVAKPAAYKLPISPAAVRTFVSGACQTSIPWGCAEDKIALALVISNVNWNWYQQNKAQVEEDLKNYLAYLVAVDVLAIETLVITQASGGQAANTTGIKGFQLQSASTSGIQIQATVLPTSSAQASSITSTVQTSATTTSNPIASAWPLEARVDPSQGISTTSASATGSSQTSDATSVYPSLAFVFSVVALLLL